jgi:hypothetical protein
MSTEHSFAYIETDLPVGLTIAEYRRNRPRRLGGSRVREAVASVKRQLLSGLLAMTVVAAGAVSQTNAAPLGAGPVCSRVPIVNVQRNDLGFRAGWPNSVHPGARGHAKVNLATRTVRGIACDVNRDGTGILVSIGHRVLYSSHHAVMFGFPGNILRTHVLVLKSTDPSCAAGTRGTLTVFASYNNVVRDSVQLAFPHACKSHAHRYTGRRVTTNVPPN